MGINQMSDDSPGHLTAPADGSAHAAIARIWAEVLRVPADSIGPNDNFFSIGGESLLIAQVMDRVNGHFYADDPSSGLRLTEFFQHTTVNALARRISQAGATRVAIAGLDRAEAARSCESVAIIGMAGRFPGARHVAALWKNLLEGADCIRALSDAELRESGVPADVLLDPLYVKRGASPADVEWFDAAYFGLTPREAGLMSPENRLLLECAEEALQAGGYGARGAGDHIGVFVGTAPDALYLQWRDAGEDFFETPQGIATLVANASPATRISYLLDLAGPSISLDTACSSSLVAAHQACVSLLREECDMALAGGATLRRPHPRGYRYEDGGVLSRNGVCRPFDELADGTVFTSGVGLVLLKRLDRALADRDPIHAVIKGSAVNNDGQAKVGYTAPGVRGQVEVIRTALARAQVHPSTIGFIETHGTGTRIGDALEIDALRQVFAGARGTNESKCILGAMKSCVGHLERAAGVAGLIKAALVLEHGLIPPSRHFTRAGPEIDLDSTPFEVTAQQRAWPMASKARRAGVSSFGVGGTNAHVVLESAPETPPGTCHRVLQLLPISARSIAALAAARRDLAEHLASSDQPALGDVAYTLQVGRAARDWRSFVVAGGRKEAAEKLDSLAAAASTQARPSRSVVFMFPGEGAQPVGMPQTMYEQEPVFREHVDQCAEIVWARHGFDFRSCARPQQAGAREVAAVPAQAGVSHTALFAMQYALAQLWMSYGVTPSCFIGYGLGEYVGACLAGVFSLEDALHLVACRGRLIAEAPSGKVLSVALSRGEMQVLLDRDCAIAAVKARRECLVSGPAPAIESLCLRLAERGITHRLEPDAHVLCSPSIAAVGERFLRELRSVGPGRARAPLVSTVTGNLIQSRTWVAPEHWFKHFTQCMELFGGIGTLVEGGDGIFVECGSDFLSPVVVEAGVPPESVIASGRSPEDPDETDEAALLAAVGKFWQCGGELKWSDFNARNRCSRVTLPPGPFERAHLATSALRIDGQGDEPSLASSPPAPRLGMPTGADRRPPAADTSAVESELAQIWKQLLGIETVRPNDRFFDIGGDSLLAMELGKSVRSNFGVDLRVSSMLLDPTVAGIANMVIEKRRQQDSSFDRSSAGDEKMCAV
jgi:acyl transferase domain-containing protein